MLAKIDQTLAWTIAIAKWLALGVGLLLFAQWPLREVIHAFSREANDLGQCLFALFVAASVTAATRSKRHIAADGIASRYSESTRGKLMIGGIGLGLLPWALFVLYSAAGPVSRSVAQLERFQDTGNPGYFLVKLALIPLLVLIIAQAAVDLRKLTAKPIAGESVDER